ncbi:MAG TPA: division plane positioning ATPase MipZ [Alphaproteobacteria bacterium]
MSPYLASWLVDDGRPRVIVLGNEKGGSGKSTMAIHVVAGLMARGIRVGSIDLDGRQATLSHFMANRRRQARAADPGLPCPAHRRIGLSRSAGERNAEDEKLDQLGSALESLGDAEVIVVDTPGSDSVLARAGHIVADVLVTPLNSSFLDLDALVAVDDSASRIVGPSPYSELVLYMGERRKELGAPAIDWIVAGNRLPNVDTRVNRQVAGVLDELAPRLGFRVFLGIHERIVFRELFLQGLTVFDVGRRHGWSTAGRTLAAARREMEGLIDTILAGELRQARAGRLEAAPRGLAASQGL